MRCSETEIFNLYENNSKSYTAIFMNAHFPPATAVLPRIFRTFMILYSSHASLRKVCGNSRPFLLSLSVTA